MRTMEVQRAKRKSERGVALVLAILFLMLVSTLAAGMIFIARSEVIATYNHRVVTQTHYVAEAGIQRTAEWITYIYPGFNVPIASFNTACYPVTPAGVPCGRGSIVLAGRPGTASTFPDANVQNQFTANMSNQPLAAQALTGTFSTDAQLLSIRQVQTGLMPPFGTNVEERWLITSTGTVARGLPPAANAVVVEQAIIEKEYRSYFGNALYGICEVQAVQGNTVVDAYHSDFGAYGGANVDPFSGDVGSNGSVRTNGSTFTVGGSIGYGTDPNPGCPAGDPSLINEDRINGFVDPMPPRPFPDIVWNYGFAGGNTSMNAAPPPNYTMAPSGNINTSPMGTYNNVRMSGQAVLQLQGGVPGAPNVYNFMSLQMGAQNTIRINPPGPIIINVRGDTGGNCNLAIAGNGIVNGGLAPGNLQINFYGSSRDCVSVSGGSNISGLLYAPYSNIDLAGTGNWYGSVVGYNVTLSGDRQLHYDLSLSDERGELTPMTVVNFDRQMF